MRSAQRFLVWTGFMNPSRGAVPQPAQQFPHDDCAATAKDGQRPRPPHQSVDNLVQLRVRHAAESSSFVA